MVSTHCGDMFEGIEDVMDPSRAVLEKIELSMTLPNTARIQGRNHSNRMLIRAIEILNHRCIRPGQILSWA